MSLSYHQTGIDAHARLETEQLISHTQTVTIDTTTSLQGSDGEVIPVSEVLELLIKSQDILDRAVSKCVGITAYILAYHFNSASRQHFEVRASQYAFLTVLRTQYLLVRHVSVTTSTALWNRLNNNLLLIGFNPN